MKKTTHTLIVSSLLSLSLLSPLISQAYPTDPVMVKAPVGTQAMTMKQAMAHPDWLGRQPEQAYWSADSQHVIYQRKQVNSELRDWWQVSSHVEAKPSLVDLQQWDDIGAIDQVFSQDKQTAVG